MPPPTDPGFPTYSGVTSHFSIGVRCIGCPWKFQCPVEQRGRQWCRACETTKVRD